MWLDRVGITLEEAVKIQPAYCGMEWHDGGWWCPSQEPEPERRVRPSGDGLVTAGSGIHALLSRASGAGERDPFGVEDPDEVRNEAPAAAGQRAQQGYRLEVNPLLKEQGPERRVGISFRLRH